LVNFSDVLPRLLLVEGRVGVDILEVDFGVPSLPVDNNPSPDGFVGPLEADFPLAAEVDPTDWISFKISNTAEGSLSLCSSGVFPLDLGLD
jgi:hypothetical protein